MTRITTLLLLLTFWSGAAFALVYQCLDKDGNLFLTNNRNKFPPGCVQVGEPIGEAPAPSPAATPPAAPGSTPGMNDRGRSSSPPRPLAPPAPRAETKSEAPSPEAAPAGAAEMPPAGAPETAPGGANAGQPGEVPDAPGQPDQPDVDTPVKGGETPAGVEADAAKEGEPER
jgi:hypothetical protein